MRVRFVHVRIRSTAMADMRHDFGHFKLPITSLFMVRNIKCGSLFVRYVALRPKSTAMVIAGRSVHLTTLFSWASLNKQLTSNRAHTFACN